MPGAVTGAIDQPLEVFGGLLTQFAPSDLPLGASPDCQDVEFSPGRVFTRAGLQSIFAAIGGNPTVNYLKTYITSNELLRTLVLDSLGGLWQEDASNAPGVLTQLTAPPLLTILPNCFGKSTTLFGREYLALSDGKLGRDVPLQISDTEFNRVSQCGPGIGPTVVDENISESTTTESMPGTVAIAAGPAGATENGNLVTITTAAPHGLLASQNVVVAGVGVAGYNNGGANPAFFTVVAVPSTTTFTYVVAASGLAASGGGTSQSCIATYNFAAPHGFVTGQLLTISGIAVAGYNVTAQAIFSVPTNTSLTMDLQVAGLGAGAAGTAAAVGNIVAGLHQVCVMFLTSQGYLTRPSPPTSWTAAGSKRAVVVLPMTNIPGDVVALVFAFTLAGGANFYYLNGGVPQIFSSNMVDQLASLVGPFRITIDFSDAVLAAGTNVDNQFNLVYLGETAGVISYNSRLVTWGSPAMIGNLLNTQFWGGVLEGNAGTFYPAGWTQGPNFFGGDSIRLGQLAINNTAYAITGDGATAVRGEITQPAVTDFRNVPILLPGTAYSVSFRMSSNGSFTQGTLHVEFNSPSGGGTLAGSFTLPIAPLGAITFQRFTGGVLNALTTVPSDTVLRIYVNGTPDNNATITITELEIFPTNQAFQQSTLLVSVADQAETFDSVNSVMQVQPYNGQAVRAAFKLRGFLYLVKERSMYQTKDDATNEPALWPIEQVSEKVGTPSLNGVAYGEDWVVIAARDGAYLFTGPEPTKISQEIQPTWDRINWAAGQTIWTEVDIKKKRILIGVPIDGATSPNRILMLDYSYLDSAAEIIEYTSIHSSTYTGKNIDIDKSRKWAIWNISANSGALIERNDGTAQTWVGNGAGTGKVYQIGLAPALGGTQTSDDGTAINSYYDTFFFLEHQLEQQLQLGSHRKLFVYLTMFVQGSGNLLLQYFPDALSAPQPLPTIPLTNPAPRDSELAINAIGNRVSFRVQTSAAGQWFSLEKFVPTLKRHDWADVRGTTT